jgi:hypothetical protein
MKQKRFPDKEPFAREAARNAACAPAEEILASLFGGCVVGLQWQVAVATLMTRAELDSDSPRRSRPRSADGACARHLLTHIIRLLNGLTRNGRKISVRGPAAYWGKESEIHELTADEIRERREQRIAELDAMGLDSSDVTVRTWERRYVPVGLQGGQAARVGVCVRQIGTYARVEREARLFRSTQPRADAEDAVMPDEGQWPYSEWILLRALPQRTLQRLRLWWGEVERWVRRREGEPRKPQGWNAPKQPPATGPPSSPAGVVPADEDSDEYRAQAIAELQALLGTREHER